MMIRGLVLALFDRIPGARGSLARPIVRPTRTLNIGNAGDRVSGDWVYGSSQSRWRYQNPHGFCDQNLSSGIVK
jgi:hypothetical protein